MSGKVAMEAAPEIPVSAPKLMQSLKDIVNCYEPEIFAILKECGVMLNCNIKEGVQMVVEDWMPVIEDAISLDQYMPMDVVVYQPPKSNQH